MARLLFFWSYQLRKSLTVLPVGDRVNSEGASVYIHRQQSALALVAEQAKCGTAQASRQEGRFLSLEARSKKRGRLEDADEPPQLS